MSFLTSVPFINTDPAKQLRNLSGYSPDARGNASGPLGVLYKNKNAISNMQYPIDLGTGPYISWITFNILESTGTATGDFAGTANKNGIGKLLGSQVTTLIQQGFGAGVDLANKALGTNFRSAGLSSFLPTARRVRATSKVIAMYMPNALVFAQGNAYNEASLTDQLGSAGLIGSAGQNGSQKGGRVDAAIAEAASPYIPLSSISPGVGVYTATGLAINPMIEVIFQQTAMRQFQFEFMMMARSAQENDAIGKIITTFRDAAKPNIAGTDGRYLIPPDEFDIKFYFNGGENQSIPKISTCVITDITTDFAPSGQYNTFNDGKPTAVRLALSFKEVEMITKQRVGY